MVGGETVQFELRTVDARSEAQRARDIQAGRPAGNVLILVPGHGQTVDGPRNLLATAAELSRSGIACCIDPVPARGGDHAEAKAIVAIARETIACLFPGEMQGRVPIQATVVGCGPPARTRICSPSTLGSAPPASWSGAPRSWCAAFFRRRCGSRVAISCRATCAASSLSCV